MKTKDGRDLPVLEITAANYIVPKGEERYIHAKIEVKQFDSKTGRRLSVPQIQKFGLKEWNGAVKTGLKKQGYEIEILHDPVKWMADHRAEMEAQAQAKAQAQAEAAKAEREKMMADLKAELKAEMAAQVKAELMAEMKTQAAAEAAQAQAAADAEKKGPGRPPKETKE